MIRDTLAILYHYARVRARPPFRTRAALERWQPRRFEQFSQRVLRRSPFYRPYVGRPLAAYPIVDKPTVMDAFDDMNTRGLKRDALIDLALRAEQTRDFSLMSGDIAVGLSSGTSGRRGLFATTRKERCQYAGAVLAKALPDALFKPHRVGLLLRANNVLYEQVNRSRRIEFRFFDLLSPVRETLMRLEAFAPDVLVGPPQALRLVAEATRSGEIRLAPEKVFAGAEVLDTFDAAIIGEAFGRRIDQIYQATEGFLGLTCRYGTLHLNEDFLVIERQYVDETSGRFMPIVTDFVRSTQPIVRYRLDDILVESRSACPCGSVLAAVSHVEGRADDILFLPRLVGHGLAPVMPDFVRDQLALCHAAISDYRLIQHGPNDFELLLEGPDREFAEETTRAALDRVFRRSGVRLPALRIGGPVPRDLGRKLRRVERRFPLPKEAEWFER